MKTLRNVVVLGLAILIAVPVMAAEGRKKKDKGDAPQKKREVRIPMGFLEGIELSDEQEAKLAEIRKDLGPKFAELTKKTRDILTEEQQKARQEAAAAAKEAGKKGKEAMEAVEAAMKLSDDQKAKMAEVKEAMAEFQKALREKVMGLLTDDQKEAVQAKMKKARGGEGKKRAKKAEK